MVSGAGGEVAEVPLVEHPRQVIGALEDVLLHQRASLAHLVTPEGLQNLWVHGVAVRDHALDGCLESARELSDDRAE